ncbi:hypothetical protein GCM10027425_26420 [Alteromonas gracilis]
MSSPSAAEAALRAADALPVGPEQVEAAERALTLAQADGDRAQEVQARIVLVAALEAARPGLAVLPHLSALLASLDGGEVTERQRFEILWECRFALARTRRSARVPLPAVRRVYADMERRYREEGASPQVYAKYRALLARDLETPVLAEAWVERWRNGTRDDLSDCRWCDLAADARITAETDPEAALRQVADLVEGREGCGEEPHRLYGEAADWAMRAGHVELAEACHRLGWPLIAGIERFAAAMSDHAMYLARAGRIGRATRLALETLPFLDERLDDLDLAAASARIARVLRAARGHRVLPETLSGRPAEDVVADLEASGRDLARRFDARNRTERVSARIAESARMRLYPVQATDEALGLDALERALLGDGGAEPRPGARLPGSVGELAAALRTASDALDAVRVTEVVEGWIDRREALLPVSDPGEHADVAYLERRGLMVAQARGDERLAAALMTSATSSAEASDDEATVLRTEIEWLHQAALTGDGEAWQRAEELVDRLLELGERRTAAGALMALSRNPDPRAGAAYAVRAAKIFATAGARQWEATALQAAGFATAWFDPREAERLLDRAHDRATALGMPQIAVAIRATQGKTAWLRGDLERAIDLYALAAEGADAFGAADPFGLRVQLCEVLVAARDWERLGEEAGLLLAAARPRHDPRELAVAHRFIGLALQELGDHHEAVEVLVPTTAAPAHPADTLVGPAVWALGRSLVGVRRPDLAADAFARAASILAHTASVPQACIAHEAAGRASWEVGRLQDAAAQYAAAARMAASAGDRDRLVSSLTALAGVMGADGRIDDALATLDRVLPEVEQLEDGLEEPDRERLEAQVDLQAGVLLIDAGDDARAEEARERLERAREVWDRRGDEADVAVVDASLARLESGSLA